eukprot:3741487-Prymnesium_polylepis.1
MHAPGKYPRDADTWTRTGMVWSEDCQLEGVTKLRRERVRQTMCGHRDAVARKAFPIACLDAYLLNTRLRNLRERAGI